jgi:hypothetical protein
MFSNGLLSTLVQPSHFIVELVSFQLFYTKCPNLWSNHVSPHSTMLFLIFHNFNKHTPNYNVQYGYNLSLEMIWFNNIERNTTTPKKMLQLFYSFHHLFSTFDIVFSFSCVKSTIVWFTNISIFLLPNSFCLKIFYYLFC